jgi:hypothetical protein
MRRPSDFTARSRLATSLRVLARAAPNLRECDLCDCADVNVAVAGSLQKARGEGPHGTTPDGPTSPGSGELRVEACRC